MLDVTGSTMSGLPLIIGGGLDHKNPFPGKIDEVQLYNKALNVTAIKELYKSHQEGRGPETLAEWKFDETTGTTTEDEIGSSDGTLYNIGDELRVEGLVRNCIDFGSGTSSSYVEVPDNEIIDIEADTSFSISVLVNINDISGIDQNVLFKGHTDNGISGHWYGIICAANELRFAVDDASKKTQLALVNAHQIMNMGSWNHIVAVRDIAKDSIYIYLNGEKVASMLDETGSTQSGLPLVIGNNPQHSMNFKGKIDELSILNVALAPSEIHDMYKEYFPIPESVDHWKFDELMGTTAIDENGSSDGTLHNIAGELRVPGLDGKCIDFGSAPDSAYIEVADNSILDFDSTTSFTISALVNIVDISADADEVVVFKGNTSNDINGHWYNLAFKNNQLRFAVDDSTTKTQLEFENANESMCLDGWNHIVGVRDKDEGNLYLYLNGVKVAEKADATGNIQSGLPLLIGNGTNHDNPFAVKIDDVVIYSEALSESVIAKIAADYGIERKPSSNSSLSDLMVGGTTIEGFSPTVIEYTMELPMGTTLAPAVTATVADDNAIVIVVPPLSLPGACNITIIAEDGTMTRYSVSFTFVSDTVAKLSDLKVDGTTVDGFNSDKTDYIVELPAGTTTVNVTATVAGTGDIAVPGTAEIVGTAEDETTKMTYEIIFSNANSIDENSGYSAKVFYNSIENCLVFRYYRSGEIH